MNPRQSLIILLVVRCFVLLAPIIQAQTQVGYVLDTKGQWFLEGHPREFLLTGQRLPAGGVIRIQSPSVDDYIVVARLNGELFPKVACCKQRNCERPIILPNIDASEKTAFGIVLEATMELIFGSPQRYSVHRTRDNVNVLAEAVIGLKNGAIDLTESFKKMPRGSYSVRLNKMSSEAGPKSSGESLGPLLIDWTPGKPAYLRSGLLRPGLYEIRAANNSEDVYLSSSYTAWVLIMGKSEFDATGGSFRKAVALTESWGEALTPEAKRRVLRAYIDQLATSQRR